MYVINFKERSMRNFLGRLGLLVWMLSMFAHAAPTGGAGLPWEAALTQIYTSITGPVALSVAGIGFVSAGAILVFGGDVPEFGRRICYLSLVVALLVTAAGVINTLFGAGALV
jgi:type IV secretion system protein VirB2